jgi:glutamyl/glutaminyl-tRNA synthetase
MPLRLALFGSLNGPAVYDIIEILGKKEVFKRIDSAIKNFIGK